MCRYHLVEQQHHRFHTSLFLQVTWEAGGEGFVRRAVAVPRIARALGIEEDIVPQEPVENYEIDENCTSVPSLVCTLFSMVVRYTDPVGPRSSCKEAGLPGQEGGLRPR